MANEGALSRRVRPFRRSSAGTEACRSTSARRSPGRMFGIGRIGAVALPSRETPPRGAPHVNLLVRYADNPIGNLPPYTHGDGFAEHWEIE